MTKTYITTINIHKYYAHRKQSKIRLTKQARQKQFLIHKIPSKCFSFRCALDTPAFRGTSETTEVYKKYSSKSKLWKKSNRGYPNGNLQNISYVSQTHTNPHLRNPKIYEDFSTFREKHLKSSNRKYRCVVQTNSRRPGMFWSNPGNLNQDWKRSKE